MAKKQKPIKPKKPRVFMLVFFFFWVGILLPTLGKTQAVCGKTRAVGGKRTGRRRLNDEKKSVQRLSTEKIDEKERETPTVIVHRVRKKGRVNNGQVEMGRAC